MSFFPPFANKYKKFFGFAGFLFLILGISFLLCGIFDGMISFSVFGFCTLLIGIWLIHKAEIKFEETGK